MLYFNNNFQDENMRLSAEQNLTFYTISILLAYYAISIKFHNKEHYTKDFPINTPQSIIQSIIRFVIAPFHKCAHGTEPQVQWTL